MGMVKYLLNQLVFISYDRRKSTKSRKEEELAWPIVKASSSTPTLADYSTCGRSNNSASLFTTFRSSHPILHLPLCFKAINAHVFVPFKPIALDKREDTAVRIVFQCC